MQFYEGFFPWQRKGFSVKTTYFSILQDSLVMGKYMLFVIVLTLKVESDHRSKFSNLTNWKGEA